MIFLIVYADVLIFLNLLVDYFLILATAKIVNSNIKTVRMVLSAIVGGFSSLYIFLPQQNIITEVLFRILISSLVVMIAFGFRSLKSFLRNTAVFFAVTCAYAGIMFAFWTLFNPDGMVMNNSVVYFNISPVVLVVCSVMGYLIYTFILRFFSRSNKFAEHCKVTVIADGKEIELDAIVDTGNSVEDIFANSEIIIADKISIESLFGNLSQTDESLKTRYRILPCGTVSGYDTLDGYRCDSALIKTNEQQIRLDKPILAVSKIKLNDGYNAIINPKTLR